MESQIHPLTELFEQLGLASDPVSITRFIRQHAPLDNRVLLAEASFWSQDQKDFLREELLLDSDWAETVDLLNNLLRQSN